MDKKKNIETKKKTIYTIISLLWFFLLHLGNGGKWKIHQKNKIIKKSENKLLIQGKTQESNNESSQKKEEPEKNS